MAGVGISTGAQIPEQRRPDSGDDRALLRDHSTAPDRDVATFIDALAFNWLIAGTDAHAKNYSLLHAPGPRLRLAPLYDMASFLPYDDDPQRTKLAMKIGGQYRLRDLGARQWQKLADEFGVDVDTTLGRVTELAQQLPLGLERVVEQATELDATVVQPLAEQLATRAATCACQLPA